MRLTQQLSAGAIHSLPAPRLPLYSLSPLAAAPRPFTCSLFPAAFVFCISFPRCSPFRHPSVTCSPSPPTQGTRWTGTCWAFHANLRYQFDLFLTLPVTYPAAPPTVSLPGLTGRTAKMYRDGAICQTVHFEPAWARHAPRWGVAHALAAGLGPWLAAELPDLVARGAVAEFVQ